MNRLFSFREIIGLLHCGKWIDVSKKAQWVDNYRNVYEMKEPGLRSWNECTAAIFKYDSMGSYMAAREELTLTEKEDKDNSAAHVLSAFPSLPPSLPPFLLSPPPSFSPSLPLSLPPFNIYSRSHKEVIAPDHDYLCTQASLLTALH